MNGPDLVKSRGLGAFPRFEAPRWRGKLFAAGSGAAAAIAPPASISPPTAISCTTSGPLAFVSSIGEIVSAWLPNGFSWLLDCEVAVFGLSVPTSHF